MSFYLQGETIKDIPKALLEDACQLVKANSIQGCKLAEVKVVYTMWSNLKKLPGMKPGEVAFHNPSNVSLYCCIKSKKFLKKLCFSGNKSQCKKREDNS